MIMVDHTLHLAFTNFELCECALLVSKSLGYNDRVKIFMK